MMNPQLGVIALVPDRWTDTHMPRHQVLKRLAAHFPVVWVEPAGGWRDYLFPIGNRFLEADHWYSPVSNLDVFEPGLFHPQVHRPPWLERALLKSRLRAARRRLIEMGARRIMLYIWRDQFANALDLVEHDVSCYHIDDEYTFSEQEVPNTPREVRLLERVNQVIVHSATLMKKKGRVNPYTAQVSNGVDYKSYATPSAESADLAAVPRPRIGYVGVIKKQIDLELLVVLARARPTYSFVLVGPILNVSGKESYVGELRNLPNVHFLGNKKPEQLPPYVQHLDVCLMCYEINNYTQYIYPLKLNEYLATGLPIVSSRIDAVLECGHVVTLASTPEEWLRAIDDSIVAAAREPALVAARRAHARKRDWDDLVATIAELFRQTLDRANKLEQVTAKSGETQNARR